MKQVHLVELTGLSNAYLSNLETGNIKKSPSVDTLSKISEALNVGVGDLFEHGQTIPLRRRVGAAQTIEPLGGDNIDYVERPPRAPKDTVAVEVTGTSMMPVYENGTILFYSKKLPPEKMINRRCVVKLASGEMLIKVIRRGSSPGLWTLQSLNLYFDDIEDVVVEWVAPIEWVKPKGE